jgi:hypothetical protein
MKSYKPKQHEPNIFDERREKAFGLRRAQSSELREKSGVRYAAQGLRAQGSGHRAQGSGHRAQGTGETSRAQVARDQTPDTYLFPFTIIAFSASISAFSD